MTAAVLALSGERMPSAVQMRVSAVFGTLSGCIWGAGNAASIIAVQSGAGLSVAYPIMQAGPKFLQRSWNPRAESCSCCIYNNYFMYNERIRAALLVR